ncbi:MAG TPA: hypothetical protein VM537_27255 [Anaerolineae bacterium]|nr:hypothetical protein [Anaerolineae bacterium]
MKGHYVALLLLTLALAAGTVACSLPLPLAIEETLGSEMTPPATQESSPTPPPTATPSPYTTAPTVLSQADYHVVQEVQLTNAGPGLAERVTLWVALIRSLEPYQEVLDSQVQPSDCEVEEDEYGNRFARFEFQDLGADESVEATLTYQVRVYELAYDLSLCQGETLSTFLDAEEYVEADDPSMRALAGQLSEGNSYNRTVI